MSERKITTSDLARKLKEQEEDYREYRHALYQKVDLASRRKILDVGCGTGVITADIASLTEGEITGIDISSENLKYARDTVADCAVTLINADVMALPFKDNTFDLVVFSVVLIYVKDQQKALTEMARVTSKDGIVLATMEPDYAGTFFYPENEIYSILLKKYEEKDVDIHTGRKLRSFFSKAGLKTEIGMYTGDIEKFNNSTAEQLNQFLTHFWYIEKLLLTIGWDTVQIEDYKRKQIELIEKNEAFWFAPAFYAIGRKE
jgi:ubiquinone/menaquinone biosynthesis C-methylase UbiE